MADPTGNLLTTDDQSVQQALTGLGHQISAMITAGQTVERINEEIAAKYVSGASSAFQDRVTDWVDRYKVIMRSVEHLMESTASASKVLTKAEDDAHVVGGNWGASDGVYSALNG
ncbi:hypothetical protein [Kitasatospora azatica]|uniref:hypothetical protein n=1 Tax=Kitasatospora azatica TaxID=58347 RepID=UPI00055BFF1F|nr:hypothetical protein [Kitasatospora azatica]